MKKLLIIILSIFYYSTIFSQIPIESKVTQQDVAAYTKINNSDFYKNPINPYDEVGKRHNEILSSYFSSENFDKISNESGKPKPSSWWDDFCWWLDGYIQKYGRIFKKFEPIYLKKISANQLLNDNTSSNIVREYGEKLIDLSSKISTTKNKASTLVNSSKLIENEVINNKKISQNDKKQILSMYSVFRWSLFFWENEIKMNKKLKKIISNPDGDGGPAPKIDWDKVACSDAIGGLFGPEGAAAASIGSVLSQL